PCAGLRRAVRSRPARCAEGRDRPKLRPERRGDGAPRPRGAGLFRIGSAHPLAPVKFAEEARMKSILRGIAMAAMISAAGAAPAATFVYVSNAEDGDIGVYAMKADGTLEPRGRIAAAKTVMPMAVSPDKRFLYAHSRSKPYSFHAYSIDGKTGALKLVATS